MFSMKNWKKIIGGCFVALLFCVLCNATSVKAEAYQNWEEIEHYDISSMS